MTGFGGYSTTEPEVFAQLGAAAALGRICLRVGVESVIPFSVTLWCGPGPH